MPRIRVCGIRIPHNDAIALVSLLRLGTVPECQSAADMIEVGVARNVGSVPLSRLEHEIVIEMLSRQESRSGASASPRSAAAEGPPSPGLAVRVREST